MTKKSFDNWVELIYWIYANLNMVMASMAQGKKRFDRLGFMVRAKAYKSYCDGSWKIHSLYDDNNWKVDRGKDECWYCNRHTSECGKLSADHILPKYLGGDDSFDNIAYACRSCNSQKGVKDFIKWSIIDNGHYPSLQMARIYMKLVYKYSIEHNLMRLPIDELDKIRLPFNPHSVFLILDCMPKWLEAES